MIWSAKFFTWGELLFCFARLAISISALLVLWMKDRSIAVRFWADAPVLPFGGCAAEGAGCAYPRSASSANTATVNTFCFQFIFEPPGCGTPFCVGFTC